MSENNGSQGPSTAPDYNAALGIAHETGDYDFVLKTALQSRKMLIDFRDAVFSSPFNGNHCAAVAMGLNFLENMISQASGQIDSLKRAAKATQEAIKAAGKNPPSDAPEAPATPPEAA